MMAKGVAIKVCDIKVVLVESVVAHNLEVVFLREATLRVNPIRIKASLLGPFKPHFKLSIEFSLVIVIILAREVVSLLGVHLLFILVVVIILGQLNFLVLVQHLGLIMVIGLLAISRDSVLTVE